MKLFWFLMVILLVKMLPKEFSKISSKTKTEKKIKFVFLPDKLDPEEFIKKYGLENLKIFWIKQ